VDFILRELPPVASSEMPDPPAPHDCSSPDSLGYR
jgi:hypothetical protein